MEFKIAEEKREATLKELERQKRIEREEALIRQKLAANQSLEEKLDEILPLINEINIIASEFKRDIKFGMKLEASIEDEKGLSIAK